MTDLQTAAKMAFHTMISAINYLAIIEDPRAKLQIRRLHDAVKELHTLILQTDTNKIKGKQMNERIKELAEHAGFEKGHQDRYGNSLSYELEKFAELIAKECADVAVNHDALDIYEEIREHFGIKNDT